MEKECKDKLTAVYEEFIKVMDLYRKAKDRNNETMSYFRVVNDNLYTLKKKL